ncbi:hypothetical protein TNCV_4678711 [Trichonephila clavipes]|nr:hypothetical protein TNCV_4678711 [Trichonephila clavipes]
MVHARFSCGIANCSKEHSPAKMQASNRRWRDCLTLANTPGISRISPATTAILATRASSESTGGHRRIVFCNMDRAYVSLAPTPSRTRPPYKAVRPTTNKALPHFNSNSVHLISEP